MKIVYKNFNRYECLNHSIRSAKFFFKEDDIYCVDFYSSDSYNAENYDKIPLDKSKIFTQKTKYNKYVHEWNSQVFSEGHNVIYELFKNYTGKILSVNEDQFFTTGDTIRDLKENDFDLAWANWYWPSNNTVNASVVCFKPTTCGDLFPFPENKEPVDDLYYRHIVASQPEHGLSLYKMRFRVGNDYKGDGIRVGGVGVGDDTACPRIHDELARHNMIF